MSCIQKKKYKRSENAVIYDDRIYGPERFSYDNREALMRILRKLEVSGIPAIWVSQDVSAKETFDVAIDRVSPISIHSAKGLDVDLVYLMGIDRMHPKNGIRTNLTALIYVAMTRSKYRLVAHYVDETEFIERMKTCLQNFPDGIG